MSLTLRNPHSVLAVFETRPQDVVDIRLADRSPSPAWQEVAEAAGQHRVPVVRQQSGRRRRESEQRGGRAGAAEACVRERQPLELIEFLNETPIDPNRPGLWLALDRLQDPQNVGAIFRTAAFFGVHGIILTRNQSAPLNSAAYDVASGGIEHVPFAQPPNLSRAIETARTAGLWILGTSEHAQESLFDIDRSRPWLLVLGNEEKGLRRLTSDKCDQLCRIPAKGGIGSLNVSVAAGVCIATLTDG